jgi:hypothetical protein
VVRAVARRSASKMAMRRFSLLVVVGVVVAALAAAFVGWWLSDRTTGGTVEATIRPNPACTEPDFQLGAQAAERGKLIFFGPAGPRDPQDDDYFHIVNLPWPAGRVTAHLPAGEYRVAFLINTDNGEEALVTQWDESFTFRVNEDKTTDIGLLIPASGGTSFPAFGD